MIYLRLFFEFFKTGLFSVGGGLATLPFLYDLSDKTGWFTHGELTNMIAVGESTPGPIGVNMATYVGFHTAGVPGAVIATLGLVTPSVIIILIIAHFLQKFRENPHVDAAFYGLRAASTAMVCASWVMVTASALFVLEAWNGLATLPDVMNWQALLLAAVVYLGSNYIPFTKNLHPIWFIGFSALVGIVFKFA